jgi:hypothetical protein
VRVTPHAVPLPILNLDRDVLLPLFHGLDSTCLSSVLASPVRHESRWDRL